MTPGIMLRTPGGNHFWHPCRDAAAGLREMAAMQAEVGMYGAAWDHADTVVEFGASDGTTFTAAERLRPKPAAPATPPGE